MSDTKKTILIVEDEPSYQHTLAEKLGMEGFDVLTAKNGEEGLALAFEKHPDLILLDLQMPKMGGIEMAKRLREDSWGKSAKIIILSNISEMEKVQGVMAQEVFEYFTKTDIKINNLLEKVIQSTK